MEISGAGGAAPNRNAEANPATEKQTNEADSQTAKKVGREIGADEQIRESAQAANDSRVAASAAEDQTAEPRKVARPVVSDDITREQVRELVAENSRGRAASTVPVESKNSSEAKSSSSESKDTSREKSETREAPPKTDNAGAPKREEVKF